jgi:hypothetical protein
MEPKVSAVYFKTVRDWFFKGVSRLARTDLKPLARVFLQAIMIGRRNQPVRPDAAPTAHPDAPAWPFVTRFRGAMCDLLLFVPDSIESHLVDHATGGFGYSHVAIDCGEVDRITGRRVMVESTVKNPVWRSRQDRYGARPFARIPLSRMGVDPAEFSACVLSHLGEQYDDLEALTWGEVNDPARQICSDLAANCLPPELTNQIAAAHRAGKLRRNSVSVHPQGKGGVRAFVSPNGFGEFFGAPAGNNIHQADEQYLPRRRFENRRLLLAQDKPGRLSPWIALAGIGAGALIGLLFSRLIRINSERSDAVGE